MRRTHSLICIALALAASACSPVGGSRDDIFSVSKVNDGKTLVTVNGREIREGFLDVLSELSPRLEAQLKNPLTRNKVLGSLVEQQLLYDEAIKRGLAGDEDVRIKSLLNRHTIVSNTLLENELDAAMQKSYEERKESQFTQIGISQITFNFLTEDEIKKGVKSDEAHKQNALDRAGAAKARIAKGEDFSAVAKEASDDKRTGGKGGVAGQVSKDDKRLARLGQQALAEAAFKLKKDEVSEPIETASAYHIIKVTSDPKVTDFEEAKRVLGFELQTTVKDRLLEELKKTAKIEYAEAKDKDKDKEKKEGGDAAEKPEAAKTDAKPTAAVPEAGKPAEGSHPAGH